MGKSKREKHETDDTDVPKAKKAKTAVPAADETLEEIDDGTAADVSMSDSRRWTDLSYDSKIAFTSAIAKPMASKKLAKRLFKLIRKASKLSRKENLRVGLKDCQLRIRKGEKGLLVFAGDVTPIEVMCHLPAVCEDKDIPYVYVPLRADISAAVGIKRPALMVLIKHNADYEELYKDCHTEVKALPLPIN